MTDIDWQNYKFRASWVGNLMVQPKAKDQVLSETSKSALRYLYIQERYGRVRFLGNKYTVKGNEVEEIALTLATQQLDALLIKNNQSLANDWVTGTPDIISPDEIIDIKSSWDLFTFFEADGSNKLYFWQLQAYMWLAERSKARLVYCLVDSPQHQIYQETRRAMYTLNLVDEEGTEEFDQMEMQVERNMTFGDIPNSQKIKQFSFDFAGESAVNDLQIKIIAARQYLAALDRGTSDNA